VASLEDIKNDYVGKTIGRYNWWAAWPPVIADCDLGTYYGPVNGLTVGEAQGNVGGTFGLRDLLVPAQVGGTLDPVNLQAMDTKANYIGIDGSGKDVEVSEEGELAAYGKAMITYQATSAYAWRVVATQLTRYAICPPGADPYDVPGTLQTQFWPRLKAATNPAWEQNTWVIVGEVIKARQWVFGWSTENASTFTFNASGSVLADLTQASAGAAITVTGDEGASGGDAAYNPNGSEEFVVGCSLYHFAGDKVTPYFP
jgi:hypothetical protein